MSHKGRPIPWRNLRTWPALFLALHIATAHAAGASNDLSDAIDQLRQEARAALESHDLPDKPDFAARFDGSISPESLRRALCSSADRHPFIDAYVRWQLLSLAGDLQFTSSEFSKLLRSLPRMVENPRADQHVIDLLERAAAAGPLSNADTQRLREEVRLLDEHTEIAATMNRPALELRDQLRDLVGDSGAEPLQLLMEQCAATIQAGWSTRSIKTRISRAFSQSVTDETLTNDQRRVIAQQVRQLANLERRSVNLITFLADGSVNVTFSNARVTERDVDAWIQRLAGAI